VARSGDYHGDGRNRGRIVQPTACSDKRFRGPTNGHPERSKSDLAFATGDPQIGGMTALLLTFVFGVLNFALHKAVLVSGHELVERMPRFMPWLGGKGSLAVEFLMLLGAMLLVGTGSPAWAWAYAGYTSLNAVAAWLILTRRV
jgi:hypothetical protein